MKLKTILIISAVTTPLLMVIMILHGSPLRLPGITPRGILDLEFARNTETATLLYNAWKPDLVKHAMKNTGIDFLFLISYAAFLSSCCSLLSRNYKGLWKSSGVALSRLMIVAAAFDAVENVLMYRTLGGNFNKEVIAATFIFAGIKFILAALGIIYILTSTAALLIRSKRKMVSIRDTNFS